MIKKYAMLSLLVFCGAHGWSIFKPWTLFQETTVKGSGRLTTKTVPISGVTSVEVRGVGTCLVVQDSSASEQLTIEADDNILPYIEIIQDGNLLLIKIKDGTSITTKSKLTYTITVKNLSEITLFGSVKMDISNLKSDFLMLDLSGASSLVGLLDVEELQVSISGSSYVELSGLAPKQEIDVSGASQFDGLELAGITADVNCSGSSSVDVNVAKSIRGYCSGVSSVRYKNSPAIKVKPSGLSVVEKN